MNDDVLVINTTPTRVVDKSLTVFPNFDDSNKVLLDKLEDFDIEEIGKPEINSFIKKMKRAMIDNNGLGLSANQCGYKFRMFVMGSEEQQITCINPKIIKTYGNPVKMREGCLSYPGMYLYVPRYEKIDAEYYDETGKLCRDTFDGITSQVYQHELDHMNGIVYTEHVGPLALKLAKDRQNKLMQKVKKYVLSSGDNNGK
jgi:peptide deformylase